jgi:putative transposase
MARPRRRFVVTTHSTHVLPVASNHVARCFAVGRPLNTVWASEVTYIPTLVGWLFLLDVVLDLPSRRVRGWAMSAPIDTALALTAFERAAAIQLTDNRLVHHSDRSRSYASQVYREALATHGIPASMSRPPDCCDNAVVESFFATLESVLLDGAARSAHVGTTRSFVEFIDG